MSDEPFDHLTIEPTDNIPDVYMWEIEFHNTTVDGPKLLKKRVRCPRALDAIAVARQELEFDKKMEGVTEEIVARLVDAFRDDDYPERECYREGCHTRYRGAGVYCSMTCAVSDA